MEDARVTVMLMFPVSVNLPLTSVARTLNVKVPDAEGVPESNPDDDKVKPVGTEPEASE
jgi:hypothetical protein